MKFYQVSSRALQIAALIGVAACGSDDPPTMINPVVGGGGAPAAPATAGMPATGGTAGRAAPTGMAGSAAVGGAAGRMAGGAAGMPMGAAGMMGPAGMGAAGEMPMAGMGAAGEMPMAGAGAAGSGMTDGGTCCPDGDCICRDEPPSSLTNMAGKYSVESYNLQGVGCVYYPTDATPPFSAVAVSDGFVGTGGCGITQTNQWGPLYASHGIVTMIINTGSGDQPGTRGMKLTRAIAAFKEENMKSGSPLNGKLAGRYGTSGFSMGGGGTTYASQDDDTLKSSVAIMPWGPVRSGIEVPTLVICGASDNIASCGAHGTPLYGGISDSVPKMRVTVSGGHNGQPSAGGGNSGKYGLAFQKLFLDGDERWRPLLVGADADQSNIK